MKVTGQFCRRNILGENILIRTDRTDKTQDGIYVLGETGDFIWAHIDEISSPEDAAALLLSEYDVDYSTALADSREFLDSLFSHGMIEK